MVIFINHFCFTFMLNCYSPLLSSSALLVLSHLYLVPRSTLYPFHLSLSLSLSLSVCLSLLPLFFLYQAPLYPYPLSLNTRDNNITIRLILLHCLFDIYLLLSRYHLYLCDIYLLLSRYHLYLCDIYLLLSQYHLYLCDIYLPHHSSRCLYTQFALISTCYSVHPPFLALIYLHQF